MGRYSRCAGNGLLSTVAATPTRKISGFQVARLPPRQPAATASAPRAATPGARRAGWEGNAADPARRRPSGPPRARSGDLATWKPGVLAPRGATSGSQISRFSARRAPRPLRIGPETSERVAGPATL